MIIIILFVIIIGLNLIPFIIKKEFPKFEKIIKKILIFNFVILLILITLLLNRYRLKGIYTNSLFELTFIITSFLFFAFVKNNRTKLLTLFLLIPLFSITSILFYFEQVTSEYKINNKYNIEVSKDVFFGCGDKISITKSELGVLRKKILTRTDLCLIEINKIVVTHFNENNAEFLIYHNEKNNSESPYTYRVQNENIW